MQTRVLLHMPVDVRSASMAVVALLLGLYTLHWAAAVVIPLLLGLMFSYALSPAVDALERWRVPRWMCGADGPRGRWWVWLDRVLARGRYGRVRRNAAPNAAHKLRQLLKDRQSTREGPLDRMQKAGTQLEQAANENASTTPTAVKGVAQVQIVRAKFNIQDYLLTGTLGLVGFAGQALVVCLLTIF